MDTTPTTTPAAAPEMAPPDLHVERIAHMRRRLDDVRATLALVTPDDMESPNVRGSHESLRLDVGRAAAMLDVEGYAPTADDVERVEMLAGHRVADLLSIVERSRDFLPIGTMADADVNRGRDIVRGFRPVGGTVADVVALVGDLRDRYRADVIAAGRTIRGAARGNGWEDAYEEGMERVTLHHPAWRGTVARLDGLRITRPDDVERYHWRGIPVDLADLANGAACVADLADLARDIEREMREDFENVAQVFLDVALERSACGVYERTVADLRHAMTSPIARDAWLDREREYRVSGTATVTISVPWSVYVTAASEDDAAEMAPDMVGDLDDDDVLSAVRDAIRYGSLSVDDLDVEDVEPQ